MINNYVKFGANFFFFNDRNRLDRIRALGMAQTHSGVVYTRPDPMWTGIKAVGDGIGTLDEIPTEDAA